VAASVDCVGRRLALLSLLLTFTAAGCGGDDKPAPVATPSGTQRTDVVQWSPFDGDGKLQSSFETQELGNGECVGRSLTIGSPGYRCKAGRWVLDPCWRSGEGVVCAGFPWDTTLSTIRVPEAKFPAHARDVDQAQPWAVELADGHRCRILQSSHATVELRGRPLPVEYDCDGGLVLLRNLTRGRVWRVATARWNHGRYAVDPGAGVRRAYFG
jgi:hypothetical protein